MTRSIVLVDNRVIIDLGEEMRVLNLSIEEAAAFQLSIYATVKSAKGSGTTIDVEALADPKIPWGKHKGTKLSSLNNGYLLWLVERAEIDSLTPQWLNERVMNEWRRRRTEPTTS